MKNFVFDLVARKENIRDKAATSMIANPQNLQKFGDFLREFVESPKSRRPRGPQRPLSIGTSPTRLVHARFSAGHFRLPAGAINASDGLTIGRRISCDIEIHRLACFPRKPRILLEGQASDRDERRDRLIPLDAGVFDPEIGVADFTPVLHFSGVEKLHARILRRDTGYYLDDASTPGGTFLNDVRIARPTPLRSGDAIRVGKSVLRFGERVRMEAMDGQGRSIFGALDQRVVAAAARSA